MFRQLLSTMENKQEFRTRFPNDNITSLQQMEFGFLLIRGKKQKRKKLTSENIFETNLNKTNSQ